MYGVAFCGILNEFVQLLYAYDSGIWYDNFMWDALTNVLKNNFVVINSKNYAPLF